jgi:hypothetical protein
MRATRKALAMILGEPHFNIQGGIHGRQPEGAGTSTGPQGRLSPRLRKGGRGGRVKIFARFDEFDGTN